MSSSLHFVDNELHRIELIDGIVHADYKPNSVVTLKLAKQQLEDRLQVSQGESRPLLGDLRNLKKLENDASEYLGRPEAYDFISAFALVTSSPIQKLIANFYFKFSKKVPVPARMFLNKQKALIWLTLYKKETHN